MGQEISEAAVNTISCLHQAIRRNDALTSKVSFGHVFRMPPTAIQALWPTRSGSGSIDSITLRGNRVGRGPTEGPSAANQIQRRCNLRHAVLLTTQRTAVKGQLGKFGHETGKDILIFLPASKVGFQRIMVATRGDCYEELRSPALDEERRFSRDSDSPGAA